jgi:hypothetical protein
LFEVINLTFDPVVWGTVADWVSGIATFIAVVISLYFGLRKGKARLKFFLNARIQAGSEKNIPHDLAGQTLELETQEFTYLNVINDGSTSAVISSWVEDKDGQVGREKNSPITAIGDHMVEVVPGKMPYKQIAALFYPDLPASGYFQRVLWVDLEDSHFRYNVYLRLTAKGWTIHKVRRSNQYTQLKRHYIKKYQ